MFHRHSTTIATGILNLNALDARNQHLLSLENKQYTVFPCGLPAELWNIIIDYLHDDRQSLSACLSAYRAWGNFCRYHIYENFIWNAQNAPSSVDRTDPDSECNVSLFHPCPQYVRHLTINGGFTDDELLDVDWLLPLACRLDIFQSVTHLEVESVDWDDIFGTHAWDTFLSAHNFLSRIKYLDLYNVPLQPFQYILDSICLFPALEKLDYLPSHVDCDNEEDVDHELYQPPSKWRVFSTEHTPLFLPTCRFWDWLSAVSFTSLSTIRLDSVPVSDLQSLSSYLHLLGGSLKEFRIRFLTTQDICDFAHSGALTKSHGLRHLEVTGFCRHLDDHIWVGEESLSFFSTVPGIALVSIRLALDTSSRRQIGTSVPSQVAALDALLSNSKTFPAVKKVRLTALGRLNDNSEQVIQRAFEKCQHKGLLAISISMPDHPLESLLEGRSQ